MYYREENFPENEVHRLDNYPLHTWEWTLNAKHATFTFSSEAKLDGKVGWYGFQKYKLSTE